MSEVEEQQTRKKKRSKKRGPDNVVFEEVNVLVTAFDTTSDLKQNAAWQIAQSLPPMLDVTPAHPSRIRIMVHPTPIPMTYAACAKFLEELTTTQPNEFNLILHLDNAIDDQKIFRLERYARKRGYDQKDAEGKFASDVTEPEHWQNFEARAQTSAATSDVMERWSSDSSDESWESSEDAGNGIAEYIFFASLAHTLSVTKRDNIIWQHRTTVELLHVPAGSDTRSIDIGRNATTSLIYAIMDSRRQRDADHDDDSDDPARSRTIE